MSPASKGDDNKATFLAEFRALRDRAGLEYEELAAKAHYPTDVLRDAELGPGLPGLPVLAAYVRACGGDETEWEERWRRLASAPDSDTGLPVRPAGASAAAVAGARAGVSVGAAEAHDPERIKAALKAHREREEHASVRSDSGFSSGMGYPRTAAVDPAPAEPAATMIANGNHHKRSRLDAYDEPAIQAPESLPSPPLASWASESLPSSSWSTEPAPAAPVPAAPPQVPLASSFSASAFAPPTEPARRASAPPQAGTAASAQRNHAPEPLTRTGSPARQNGHPGLLALAVIVVIIGCVALLILT